MSNPTWSAGAHSEEPLSGDGWFIFSVPAGSVGVAIGLNAIDTTTSPSEPRHGFLFGAGKYRVIESGVARTAFAPYASGDLFAVVRQGATIYYCKGVAGQAYPHAETVFALPGEVVYRSSLPSQGAMFLDAAMLIGGDKVVDAKLVPAVGMASVSAALEPLLATISQDGVAGVSVSFGLLQAEASSGNGAHLVLEPPGLFTAQHDYSAVAVAFEPMQVAAEQGETYALNGARLQMHHLGVTAAGAAADRAFLSMPAPQLAASQSERAEVTAGFTPMRVITFISAQPVRTSPHITAVIPAFSGLPGGGAVPAEVDDVALASDTTYASHYTVVSDGAFAADEPIAGAISTDILEDSALASDAVMVGTSVLLEDGALAGDELLATVSDLLLQDAAWASSEVMPQSDGAVLLEDGALASDAALPYAFADVTGGALAGDDALIATVALLEGAAIADDEVVSASLQGPALLEDEALAGDGLLAWTDAFALLQDTAVASEQLFMKTPGLVAWVMNTDTGAVSWYDNWAFTSMAVVGGRVFAAGPDGLHILGGDLDGTETIDARVQFGYTEFGGYDQGGMPKPSEQKKRVSGLWFGYHAGGELEATVETYGQGYGPYTYAMAARAAEQPRNNRIVPGKGLNARYWRIAVANTAGCAFEVHSIAAEVTQSTRRL